MLLQRQVTISFIAALSWITLIVVMISASCIVPRKYPVNKPFVFKTNIKVEGNLKVNEKQELESRLANQLDDSLKTRIVSFAGIRKTLVKPAVFDTNYANRSVVFMKTLLNAVGYYQAQITWDSTLKFVGRQQRVTVDFEVLPGKNLKLDSIGYAFTDTALQNLAIRTRGTTLLAPDEPYSQQIISAELDRLVNVFKDNGYYKISKEDLYAEVDTVFEELINPGLDPFEQIRLLNELQNRKENPLIDVVFKQRVKEGASQLRKFYVRNVSIYPDLQLFDDSTRVDVEPVMRRGIQVFNKDRKFKSYFLARNSSLLPGNEYKQSDYFKTINTYSQLGAWQQVNVEIIPIDSIGMLDIVINLYPAKKLNLVIDLEATRNSGDVIATSNLFGIGLNIGLRNRNLAREPIQSTTNVRGGIELGTKTSLIQTTQGSFSQNIFFPKFILPFRIRGENRLSSSRTILNFNTSYTDRRDFFTLGSINGSIGYEWSKKNHVWFYSPLNIELLRPGPRDSLERLFVSIPNLRFSFNNGFVIGQNLVYRTVFSNKNKISSLKMGLEESGAIMGIIKHLDRDAGLYRYVKLDADFRHLISFDRSAWAFRAYAGVGIPYGRQNDSLQSIETSLPFAKSFFAGGPNSMRGWQIRRLGPGSSDTLEQYDRFGDIMLEGNVEFRFNIGTIGGVKVKSALFTDIGNIWNRSDYNNPALVKTDFRLNRFYRDLAVAGGTSLRLDFNYFLLRFDWAYKLKDPVHSEVNNGWFHDISIGSGQFQLGINYPF